jgi:protein-S-isoprenylcysteine O-methyltransferase Ste14
MSTVDVTSVRSRPTVPVLLDLVERLTILALYLWLVARIVASMSEGAGALNGLILISEGSIVFFVLIRRTTLDVSRDPADWFFALAATCAPLFVVLNPGQSLVPVASAGFIWIVGTILQISAKLTLRRSFGCVPANRGLKLGGPYRFVRHPMYAGYLLCHVAYLLINPNMLNLLLLVLCDCMQIPRLLAEERLLGRDPRYLAYRDEVPWRVIPGVF